MLLRRFSPTSSVNLLAYPSWLVIVASMSMKDSWLAIINTVSTDQQVIAQSYCLLLAMGLSKNDVRPKLVVSLLIMGILGWLVGPTSMDKLKQFKIIHESTIIL